MYTMINVNNSPDSDFHVDTFIRPGPEVGEILSRLLDAVIAKPEYNQKGELTRLIQTMKKKP